MNSLECDRFDEERVKSDYLRKWLNLLCDTQNRYDDFVDKFMDDTNLFHSACSYQKYLREEEGRGNNIKANLIEEAVEKKDHNRLSKILEEVFIEPIDDHAIDSYIRLVNSDEVEPCEIIKLHNENKDRSFWLTLKKIL